MIAAYAPTCEDMVLRIPLSAGWEMTSTEQARAQDQLSDLQFMPAQVPGTVASALRGQRTWRRGEGRSLDGAEYWFRCRFDTQPAEPGEEVLLELEGIATVSEVWLNGSPILNSSSMFQSHRVDVSSLLGHRNELLIVCRSLSAALKSKRGQTPPARWRTRVVSEQQLRWFRTTLLGRAPGFAPEPAPVGPWRPVTLVRRRKIAVEHWSRQVEPDGATGVVRADLHVRALMQNAQPVHGTLRVGEWSAPIEFDASADGLRGHAVLRIPEVRRWWPHTHGEPNLYPVRVELELKDGSTVGFDDVPAGFRSVSFDLGHTNDTGRASGRGLAVNGIPIFCRGVIWTPPDPVALASSGDAVRQRLELLRDGGFNLIRLAGTMVYESELFHRLCDELGLLVWQDMMFANMDYPFADPAFGEAARGEAESEVARLAQHASTAMICGNSEIEQQVGMLGLDPALGRGPFFEEELPRIVARHGRLPYIPSAPSGGDQPFRTDSGVANYFGVSAYLRPLEDVRRAEVRFASECLAFANVPEQEMIDEMALTTPGGISPSHPAWKRAVPRDAGAGWDFEDVRDHYLKLLYAVEPAALRYAETRRYWELSRMVSGEVMAEVFGEWRRHGSPCGGGIILWGADLEPGAGWGILDSQGRPKAAYWFLKRALAPCAVWTTDEGLNGVDVHVANDGALPLAARLRVALYARGEQKVAEAERTITLGEHTTATFGVEQILGRFVDASCAYRFGPPGHDLIVASLYLGDEDSNSIDQNRRGEPGYEGSAGYLRDKPSGDGRVPGAGAHDQYPNDQYASDQHLHDQHSHDQHAKDARQPGERRGDDHRDDQHSYDRHSHDQHAKDARQPGERRGDDHRDDQHSYDRHSHDQHSNDARLPGEQRRDDRHSHDQHSQDQQANGGRLPGEHSHDAQSRDDHPREGNTPEGPAHDARPPQGSLRPGESLLAQSFRFPAGRTIQRVPISELGLTGFARVQTDGSIEVLLSARRFAHGVRVTATGAVPDDCYFGIEPAGTCRIVLTPVVPGQRPSGLAVTAINAEGPFPIAMEKAA